ncbi:MAG TPA: Gfo/Idh/MocA family oxidoreductase [Candidatus Binatia bacterium]|jgi:predicted dehydrogenase|nr:Gfo/Idh/MocA family oxidoreductase [Candidatus Binatia bacterium]
METNETSSAGGLPRRDFIKKTAAATAAVAATSWLKTSVYGQNQAPSANVTGANNRIAVAVVGVGFGIGQNHLIGIQENCAPNNTVVAAACDVFNKRRDFAKGKAPNLKDADLYNDHRKLLERKDIDAVLIATHDPWHAQITIDSLEAGKHVYCEKPMTRYLDEAFKVYDTVKRTGKTFQVGSQGCSAGGYHKCAEMIKAGKLGTLVWAQAWYSRNSLTGEWNYPIETETKAENIDWERWLGSVKKRDSFSAEEYHRWRKYFQYCAGPMGDLAPHRLHPLMLATGNPEFPIRVCSIGTKNVHADKAGTDTPERDVPEHQQLLAEFPSGLVIMVTCCTVNGSTPGLSLYGHKANLNIDATAARVELLPQREFGDEIDPETVTGMQPEDIRVHERNWFDCIRSGKTPNADIELAIRVQTVISLAEMSNRLKITCLFDEKTRKISDASGKEIPPITYGTLPLS